MENVINYHRQVPLAGKEGKGEYVISVKFQEKVKN